MMYVYTISIRAFLGILYSLNTAHIIRQMKLSICIKVHLLVTNYIVTK